MNILKSSKRRSSAAGRSRDTGLRSAGKGDTPRSNWSPAYHRNFKQIDGEGMGMFGEGKAADDPRFVQVKPGRFRRKFRL